MNLFGVRSREDRHRDRDRKIRESRAANVAMIRAAIEDLAPGQVPAILIAILKDDQRLSPHDLELLANALGREAHERGRRR